MIPRDAMIHSLEQLAAEAKPAKVRMRTDMVHETVLQLREKADDPKLLEDWQAIEAEPSRDGWQWVEARFLTYAAHSLRRVALVLLFLLAACPLWAQSYPEATIPVLPIAPPLTVVAVRDVPADLLPSSTFQRFQIIAAVNELPLYPPEQPPLIDPMRQAERLFGASAQMDVLVADQQSVITMCVAIADTVWNEQHFTDATARTYAQQIVTHWNTTRTNDIAARAAYAISHPSEADAVLALPAILPMELGGVLHDTFRDNVPIFYAVSSPSSGSVPITTAGNSALSWMSISTPTNLTVPAGDQVGGYKQMQDFLLATGCDGIHHVSHTDPCGIAYECASSSFPFSSSDVSCTTGAGQWSGIHEIAHNICANHEPESDCGSATCGSDPNSSYTYAHGNGIPAAGSQQRDPETYPRQGGVRILHWTSPYDIIVINGVPYPLGIANTKDNARALRTIGPSFANFRVTVTTPFPVPSAGGKPAVSQP